MGKTNLSEWMWRFLAIVITFSVGWTLWIIYQLNPPPLVMKAAFEAAAKARVKGTQSEKQNVQGLIAPSAGAAAASTAAEAPKEAPINPGKLKFSETIALPVPNAKQ